MKAFLEKIGGEWYDDFVYISKYPLIERGYTIIPYDGDDLENTLFNKPINPEEDIIVGTVSSVSKFLKHLGAEIPKSITYPLELRSFLKRDIRESIVGELGNDFPYFVKPADDIKLFTGDVVSRKEHIEYIRQDGATDETKVWVSELIDFQTEYRCFITNGIIKGIKHYKGDFKLFIDTDKVQEMVDAYKDCPSAYTLDVGLDSDGDTVLVEANDFWALGSYGLDGDIYALLTARRMRELLRNIKY